MTLNNKIILLRKKVSVGLEKGEIKNHSINHPLQKLQNPFHETHSKVQNTMKVAQVDKNRHLSERQEYSFKEFLYIHSKINDHKAKKARLQKYS